MFWKEDCSQYDVDVVFKEVGSCSVQDKFKFIENVWKPGELFDFPASVECSNTNRHFVWSWMKRFPWLAYSKYADGAFCFPVCLFWSPVSTHTLDVVHFAFYQTREREM